MKLNKYKNNPILKPTGEGDWEKMSVLNPGAWYENGKVSLLYRAAAETVDYKIYLGLAESTDGYNFKRVSDKPVLAPSADGFDAGCIEDARIVKFGDTFYVTYAARAYPPGAHWAGKRRQNLPSQARAWTENLTRTGLASSKDLRTFKRLGPITADNLDDRDAIIFPEKIKGKYVMIHRPYEWIGEGYPNKNPSIWMAWSDNMLDWSGDKLMAQAEAPWEYEKVGGNAPPLKTDEGWLMLYHAVGSDKAYRIGVMMLDLEDPLKIIARAPDFILEPEEVYEKVGVVNNVVFPCGNVIIGDELFVYYGGADTVCCVATVKMRTIIDYVMKFRR